MTDEVPVTAVPVSLAGVPEGIKVGHAEYGRSMIVVESTTDPVRLHAYAAYFVEVADGFAAAAAVADAVEHRRRDAVARLVGEYRTGVYRWPVDDPGEPAE